MSSSEDTSLYNGIVSLFFFSLYLFLLPSLPDSGEGGEKREGGIQHKEYHCQKTLASTMELSLFFSVYTSFFSLLSLIWGREVRREREGDKGIQHKEHHHQKTLASTMALSPFLNLTLSLYHHYVQLLLFTLFVQGSIFSICTCIMNL